MTNTAGFPLLPLKFLYPYRPLALAFLSGVVMSWAAAPLNWWGLAWVALAPLWALVINPKPVAPQSGRSPSSRLATLARRLARWLTQPTAFAGAWGLGYHGCTLWWITGLHPLTWLGVPWLASVGITLFCWLFITLWGTVPLMGWAWVLARQGDRPTWFRLLLGVAGWCAVETWLNLTPLSWTALSFTQSPGNVVILHLGRLSGPLLVTAVIVGINGLWAEGWHALQRQAIARSKRLGAIAIGLLLMAHLVGFGLYAQPLGDRPEAALNLGIIQGNIPTREKLFTNGIRRAVQEYVGGYERLAQQGVDAVLTPEGALPLFWNAATNPVRQAVLAQGVPIWLGTFVKTDRQITQSLLAIAGNGEVVGRYNKVKLVPLGEYIPFQEVLGQLIRRLSPVEANMVPGSMHQQFDTPVGRAIASICYESAFPALFRNQARAGGELILTASNLDPYSEVLMAQHQAQDLLRAIETDRWAARATNTGYSSFIDPHGHILWRSRPLIAERHAATIYRRQTQTLYVRWGDWLTPSLLLSSLVAAIALHFSRSK